MVSNRVVMFVSRDAGHRELYASALRGFGLLSVWTPGVDDGQRLLAQYRVNALIFHPSSEDEWGRCRQLVAAAHSSPVLVLGPSDATAGQVHEALDAGCAGFIAAPCPSSSLAGILRRAMNGDRGIVWPETLLPESLAG